jgi:hypothetical protein
MVKCGMCLKVGRKLESCGDCLQGFSEKARRNKGKKEIGEGCGIFDSKIRRREVKCHRCQSFFSENIALCSSVDCKEAFCSRCLKYRYKIDIFDLHPDWECFICNKTCSCKTCRKAVNSKNKPYSELSTCESHFCHQCSKKISSNKLSFCEKCKNYWCLNCKEEFYKNLENCPVCLDICMCSKCGDQRFYKDFPKFDKGIDLRVLYPYDLENIFYVNGFWVRSINL